MPDNDVITRRKPLSAEEQAELGELCGVVRQGLQTFVDVGRALKRIREGELYREKCATYEAFLQIEFGISRQRAHQLIGASEVVDHLASTMVDVPENERQARELDGLTPGQQTKAWRSAVSHAARNGVKVTAGAVRQAVDRVTRRNGKHETPEEMAAKIVGSIRPKVQDDTPEIDPMREWERSEAECKRLRALTETLSTGKAERELVKLTDRYARLEGRLSQAMTTAKEAESEAKYAKGVLAKVRKALGVTADAEIMPAIADLRR